MADRCAEVARIHHEPVGGSASRARRWLLVEQPGAWGREAIRESGLPATVADHLDVLHRELPARVLLIRRSGNSPGDGGDGPARGRTVLAGVSHPEGGGWLERFLLDDVEELLELDLGGLSTGVSVGGERVTEPLYLVCTNGKHDACCATFGLPVAKVVTDRCGDRAWECSHVGGDRFAGNLVCLPDGIFYGHLDPDAALLAVDAHEEGRLLPGYCRGRSALPFPAQAAELLTRERLGLHGLDELRFRSADRAGDHHRVRFARADGSELIATVRRSHDPAPRVLTCGTAPAAPPVHELVDLRPAVAAEA